MKKRRLVMKTALACALFALVTAGCPTGYGGGSGAGVLPGGGGSGNYTVTLVAGGTVGSAGDGSVDGTGAAAGFYAAFYIAADSQGNLYVTERHRVRKITPDGVVTTLAGAPAGTDGQQAFADGTGPDAKFNGLTGIAIDSQNNIYVGDSNNHRVRKITPVGVVTTLAGSSSMGHADGTGAAAQFRYIKGVAVDSADNVYAGDTRCLRKITPGGTVTTIAGDPNVEGYADGTGTAAKFESLKGLAVDSAGNIYVADDESQMGNSCIRKVTPAGQVTTFAGDGNQAGDEDGLGTAARFDNPEYITADSAGNLYVTDRVHPMRIRKITPAGQVTTIFDCSGTDISGITDLVVAGSTIYVIASSKTIYKLTPKQ